MIPLLASGTTPAQVGGPLAGINMLDSRDESQLFQFVEDAAGYLNVSLDKASSYAAAVNQLAQLSQESVTKAQQQPNPVEALQLSEEAKELLTEAASDNHRMIVMVRKMGRLSISTNGKSYVEMGNPRSEARWEQSIWELLDKGLIRDPKGQGQVFEVTNKGFELAETLGASK